MDSIRRQAAGAANEVENLHREVAGLRQEVKDLTIRLGSQLTIHSDVLAHVDRRLSALETGGPPAGNHPGTRQS